LSFRRFAAERSIRTAPDLMKTGILAVVTVRTNTGKMMTMIKKSGFMFRNNGLGR